jgi:hypothetical protein
MRRFVWLPGLMVLVLAVANPFGFVAADQGSRAGLVVQFGDGHVVTRCIAFEEDEISGSDLLARSGLDVVIDASRGMGVTVCRIEGEGCDYPSQPCFCQCMGGGECGYWNYFYRDAGEAEWTYSALGALLRQVRPGSTEAWVWGDGRTPPSDDLTFEAICAMPTPTATRTPVPPTASPATVLAEPTKTRPSTPRPIDPPTATVLAPSPTSTPAPNISPGQSLISYWPFGLMLLALVAVGAIIRLRRT